MQVSKEFSVKDAKEKLSKKDALKSCHKLVSNFHGQLKDQPKKLKQLGFESEFTIPVKGLNPRFDAYHENWKVGVELEKGEQMNVRSHLLFTEIAFQKEMIDVAVYILPIRTKYQGKQANFNRTKKELNKTEIFSEKYFPLEVPIYLIGYK